MFGLETEYAITQIERRRYLDRDLFMNRFLGAARKSLVHLPDAQSNGMFLANGSRLYVDYGQHPELATPECTDPWEVVRYLKAGERIISAVIEKLCSEIGTGAEIICSLCNVDYLQDTTWGCHESYLHQCDAEKLAKHIIPHLVTRTIFTGTGGFDASSAGLQFTLSPRAHHISHTTSCESTGERGIYHTKDESLSSRGYHRLHIICGESQRSESGIWLKVGTTAVIVAMIEAGLEPCSDLELAFPVKAFRAVAADTECEEKLELAGGRTARAIDIQRRYLELAEEHRNDAFMPPWTERVCSKWRQILDLLAESPVKASRMLDWTIKHALYTRHIENRGMKWETIRAWSKAVVNLQSALRRSGRPHALQPDFILGPNSPVLEEVARLTPYLRKEGLSWDGWADFLRLKQEMLEIDTRYGQLGERSIFRSLERAGMLEHHVDGVDNIEHAISNPPGKGRARIRGEMVRQLHERNAKYKCGWYFICDEEERPVLDLSDPFAGDQDMTPVDGRKTNEEGQFLLPFGSSGIRTLEELLRMRGRSL